MIKKEEIFVMGYWKTNLGDDLFLYTLCNYFPQKKFVIIVENEHSKVFSEIENLKMIKTNIFIKVFNKFFKLMRLPLFQDYYISKRYNNLIELGGSIFIEDENWRYKIKRRKFLKRKLTNYYVVSSNFGPVKTNEFLNHYIEFLQDTKAVFRDSFSYKLLGEKVKYGPDLIFMLPKIYKIDERKDRENYVIFSVIDLDSKQAIRSNDNIKRRNSYEKKIEELIINYVEDGKSVVLMSFCDYEGDIVAIERIVNNLPNYYYSKVKIYSHKDIGESLELLNGASEIIGTRFHSILLGIILNKKTFAISYSEKTNNMLNDLFDNDSIYLSLSKFESLSYSEFQKKSIPVSSLDVKNIVKKSLIQLSYLEETLGEQDEQI